MFLSCQRNIESYTNEEIKSKIDSDIIDEIIEGYYIVGEKRKTEFIPDMYENPLDSRISHNIKFYGMSIYQSKMIAMKKISKLTPPHDITYSADSTVINFYYRWAVNSNYLKK